MDTIVDSLFCFFVTLGEFELKKTFGTQKFRPSLCLSTWIEATSGFSLCFPALPLGGGVLQLQGESLNVRVGV